MPLLTQSVSVKAIGTKVMVSYHCEHDEPVSFILTNENARELAGLLTLAANATTAFFSEVKL